MSLPHNGPDKKPFYATSEPFKREVICCLYFSRLRFRVGPDGSFFLKLVRGKPQKSVGVRSRELKRALRLLVFHPLSRKRRTLLAFLDTDEMSLDASSLANSMLCKMVKRQFAVRSKVTST